MLVDVLADKPETYTVAGDGSLAIQVNFLSACRARPREQQVAN